MKAWSVRLATIGLAATAVLALGTWIYVDLQRELRALASANLRALLDMQAGVLETWIREKQLNVERWAGDSRIVEVATVLNRLAPNVVTDSAPAALVEACRGAASDKLVNTIDSLRQSDAAEGVNLVDHSGRVLASRTRAYCGLTLTQERLQQLAPVFEGRAIFAPPMSESERLNSAVGMQQRKPLVWFSAPVRNGAGDIIAALKVGKFAHGRFASSLLAARPGSTGEAYAFDAHGRMLLESRIRGVLEQSGAVKKGDSTILSVRLDDPQDEEPSRSLTALATIALEGIARSEGAVLTGEILQPFTNYIGKPVIGAWRWLPQYGFGIAVETGRDEVFAPLRRLEIAYQMIGVLTAAVLLALVLATIWIQKLWRQRDEARRVGNYELLEQIAEGGMASVWRARHRLLKRPVAVKLLSLRVANDEGSARFEREVRLASQLMHPNTVAVFDYGHSSSGELFCVMELLDGITVQQLIERFGPQSPARVAWVMQGIAGSLSEAHERGLVHRDIKPANVMLCRRGADVDVVKVLDFGLVKSVAEPHTQDLTRALRILGTPSYMAPERIEHPATADIRSDLYSVGALGYFMLAGKPPYEAENDLSLAYKVVNAPVPLLDVDGSLSVLIGRCLQKDVMKRPQSAQEVIDLLQQVMREAQWTAVEARSWWTAHHSEEFVPSG